MDMHGHGHGMVCGHGNGMDMHGHCHGMVMGRGQGHGMDMHGHGHGMVMGRGHGQGMVMVWTCMVMVMVWSSGAEQLNQRGGYNLGPRGLRGAPLGGLGKPPRS